MKNLTEIVDGTDLVTKDYVDLSAIIDSTYNSNDKEVILLVGSLDDADSTEY